MTNTGSHYIDDDESYNYVGTGREVCEICHKAQCDSMAEEIEHRAQIRARELWPTDVEVMYTIESRKPFTPTQVELDW